MGFEETSPFCSAKHRSKCELTFFCKISTWQTGQGTFFSDISEVEEEGPTMLVSFEIKEEKGAVLIGVFDGPGLTDEVDGDVKSPAALIDFDGDGSEILSSNLLIWGWGLDFLTGGFFELFNGTIEPGFTSFANDSNLGKSREITSKTSDKLRLGLKSVSCSGLRQEGHCCLYCKYFRTHKEQYVC